MSPINVYKSFYIEIIMLEEIIATMPLWQKVLGYTFLLLGLAIYVQTGKLKVMGRALIPNKWRIILALFFPVIFAIGIVFGAVIFGALIVILIMGTIISLLSGKKPKLPKLNRIKINIIRKYQTKASSPLRESLISFKSPGLNSAGLFSKKPIKSLKNCVLIAT